VLRWSFAEQLQLHSFGISLVHAMQQAYIDVRIDCHVYLLPARQSRHDSINSSRLPLYACIESSLDSSWSIHCVRTGICTAQEQHCKVLDDCRRCNTVGTAHCKCHSESHHKIGCTYRQSPSHKPCYKLCLLQSQLGPRPRTRYWQPQQQRPTSSRSKHAFHAVGAAWCFLLDQKAQAAI
jgi:hypothetical protein